MKNIATILASMTLLAGGAHAATQSFQYTSTVTGIEYSFSGWGRGENFPSATLPTGFVKLGDSVSGSFTYELASHGPGQWGGADYEPPEAYINIGNGAIKAGGVAQGGVTWVHNNDATPQGDSLRLFSYFYASDYHFRESVNVMLDDPTGTVLSGYQLPGTEATGFRSGTFMYEYESVILIDGEYRSADWYVTGTISELKAVSAVPEPGTYAMLLAGLGLVAWRRKRA